MRVDLGSVSVLGADAVGQPGQRRFRLFARSSQGSAVMWMEKEQLNNLSIALDRALALLTEGQVLRTEAQMRERPKAQGMPADFPRHPNYEFQVGQMGLNFNEEDSTFILSIVPFEIIMERGQEPHVVMREEDELSFVFTQQVAQNLSTSITSIVTAGRPVCPFCHTPLDGRPHACVKQNGHREIIQIEENDDETD